MTENKIKIIFSISLFLIGIAIGLLCFTAKGCNGSRTIHTTHTDTIISLAPPVIKTYTFTNPTVYKEITIIYDSTRISLTKKDSDFIVNDYLKRREYQDSVKNGDTSTFYWHAIIEKNQLTKMNTRLWIRPKIYSITKIIEPNYLLIGCGIGYYGKLTAVMNISYQKNKFDYGISYDPFLKGGYLTIKRKFKL